MEELNKSEANGQAVPASAIVPEEAQGPNAPTQSPVPTPSQEAVPSQPLARVEAAGAQESPEDGVVSGHYPFYHWLLGVASITAFFGLSVWLVWRMIPVAANLSTGTVVAISVGALFIGILSADFVSGLVHWAADNWGTPDWPIVGQAFIRPFRRHHLFPKEMCEHGFVEMNGNNCFVSLWVFFVADYLMVLLPGALGLSIAAWLLSFCWWVFGTNQFHGWAHSDTPPRFVQWLQEKSIILNKDNHEVHHTFPHDSYYCITTGWLNPLLSKLRFFQGLEALITAITGVKPFHEQAEAAQKAKA